MNDKLISSISNESVMVEGVIFWLCCLFLPGACGLF